MKSTFIPISFQLTSAFLIFALGVFLVAAHVVLATRAADRSALGPRSKTWVPWLIGAWLSLWLAAGLLVGEPANLPGLAPELRLAVLLAVGFGPMVLAALLLPASRVLRELNASMPPDWLIRVQAYRMAGVMFLLPFLYFGALPAAFAVPAAVGDFLTGLAAPFVASAVARRRPGAVAWAIAWNVFGIADLVVAPAAAVVSGANIAALFPLVLVPLFSGPPLGILTHVYSLRNLLVSARRGEAGIPEWGGRKRGRGDHAPVTHGDVASLARPASKR